jgi:N6-adenosine-specific RNA methylase IME4
VEAEDLIGKLKEVAKSNQGTRNDLTSNNLLLQVRDPNENAVATKLADAFNTNRTYINEAAKAKKENPEVFEQLKNGSKTITEAKKEERKQQRDQFIQQQRDDIASGRAVLAEGLYEVIAIDPPWAYEEKGGFSSEQHDQDGNRGGVDYPTMTVEQIKNIVLPITDEGVVFLWTTHAFLKDAFDILLAWGLNYKATIVWDKEIMGMGRTIRFQCEFCLLAFKGKPIFEGSSERDIIRAKRREHSRKPDEFYELVERTTVGRKLEYFSREQRNGWAIYGNDTEKF